MDPLLPVTSPEGLEDIQVLEVGVPGFDLLVPDGESTVLAVDLLAGVSYDLTILGSAKLKRLSMVNGPDLAEFDVQNGTRQFEAPWTATYLLTVQDVNSGEAFDLYIRSGGDSLHVPDTTARYTIGETIAAADGTWPDTRWLAVDLRAGETYEFFFTGNFRSPSSALNGIWFEDGRAVEYDGNEYREWTEINEPHGNYYSLTAPEDGTYYIEARPPADWDTSGQLQSRRVVNDAVGDTYATAMTLQLGEVYATALESLTDLDMYAVYLEAGEYYEVHTPGLSGWGEYSPASDAVLRDPFENYMWSLTEWYDSGPKIYAATYTGVHYVVAYAGVASFTDPFAPDDYSVQVRLVGSGFDGDLAEVRDKATLIGFESPYSDEMENADDSQWLSLQLYANQTVHVTLDGAAGFATDDQGAALAVFDRTATATDLTLAADGRSGWLTAGEAGLYFLHLTAEGTGAYSVSLDQSGDAEGHGPDTLGWIQPDRNLTGSLDFAGDRDGYNIYLVKGDVVEGVLDDAPDGTTVEILSHYPTPWQEEGDPGRLSVTETGEVHVLQSGVYEVRVTGQTPGDYQVRAASLAPMIYDVTNIGPGSFTTNFNAPYHVHTYDIDDTEGRLYQVTVDGTDGVGEMVMSAWRLDTVTTDEHTFFHSYDTFSLRPADSTTGSYTVDVTLMPETGGIGELVAVDGSARASIDFGGHQFRSGTRSIYDPAFSDIDVFSVEATAGQALLLELDPDDPGAQMWFRTLTRDIDLGNLRLDFRDGEEGYPYRVGFVAPEDGVYDFTVLGSMSQAESIANNGYTISVTEVDSSRRLPPFYAYELTPGESITTTLGSLSGRANFEFYAPYTDFALELSTNAPLTLDQAPRLYETEDYDSSDVLEVLDERWNPSGAYFDDDGDLIRYHLESDTRGWTYVEIPRGDAWAGTTDDTEVTLTLHLLETEDQDDDVVLSLDAPHHGRIDRYEDRDTYSYDVKAGHAYAFRMEVDPGHDLNDFDFQLQDYDYRVATGTSIEFGHVTEADGSVSFFVENDQRFFDLYTDDAPGMPTYTISVQEFELAETGTEDNAILLGAPDGPNSADLTLETAFDRHTVAVDAMRGGYVFVSTSLPDGASGDRPVIVDVWGPDGISLNAMLHLAESGASSSHLFQAPFEGRYTFAIENPDAQGIPLEDQAQAYTVLARAHSNSPLTPRLELQTETRRVDHADHEDRVDINRAFGTSDWVLLATPHQGDVVGLPGMQLQYTDNGAYEQYHMGSLVDGSIYLFTSDRKSLQTTEVRVSAPGENGGLYDLKYMALLPDLLGTASDDALAGTTGNDEILGGDGDDWLFGEAGRDVMQGGSGHDLLVGMKGSDLLFGRTGDDVLSGDRGRDRLRGNDGDDTLIGGAQNDVLQGGAGADVFVFEGTWHKDLIKDFQPGIDRIQVIGLDPEDLRWSVKKADGLSAVAKLGAGQTIVFEGVDVDALRDLDDWDFL